MVAVVVVAMVVAAEVEVGLQEMVSVADVVVVFRGAGVVDVVIRSRFNLKQNTLPRSLLAGGDDPVLDVIRKSCS